MNYPDHGARVTASARQLCDLPALIHRAGSGTDPDTARWLLRLFIEQVRTSGTVADLLLLHVECALLPAIVNPRHAVDGHLGLVPPRGHPPTVQVASTPTNDVATLMGRCKAGDTRAAIDLLNIFFTEASKSEAVDRRLLNHHQRAVMLRIAYPKCEIVKTLGLVRPNKHRPNAGPSGAHIELRDMALVMLRDEKRMASVIRSLQRDFPDWSRVTIRNEVRIVRRFLRAVDKGSRSSLGGVLQDDPLMAAEFDRRSQDEIADLAEVRYEPDDLTAAFFGIRRPG